MNKSKRDISLKSYSPLEIEQKWQKKWQDLQAFKANVNTDGDPFCIVIPPPNVTGSLHMGHAFNTTLIDVIVRFQRLAGKNVLCLPGTDHASIAVQTILEKQIKKDGLEKEDIGRIRFLEKAWEWKEKSGGQIISQLKSLGYSVDWSRERFTLDQKLNDAVVEAFILLHNKGLIYRGEYLVNWCPASQSAVSDLEVEMREIEGNLWHFKYLLLNEDGSCSSNYLEVATTRPETLLGDTAVAVNSLDKRYQDFIGRKVRVPFVDRDIPVVGDSHVDMEFGTGCVKVTPAHDTNDFEIGKRNNLEQINIMNKDGTLNDNAGKFRNLDRYEARKLIISELDSIGLLTRIEEYKHTVPFSDRGKVPIEPLLSTQWFLKMNDISRECLEKNNLEQPNFIPKRWQKVYKDWLVNINDWCLSRQLWWGHQIPAWYVLKNYDDKITQNTPYIIARNEKDALKNASEKFGPKFKLVRDKDVLDTWFSSGLWPFSTLGWPNIDDKDFKKWYPNSLLVTGFDIIFFWVARMTMMGNIFTSKIPFQDVYIHGLVRDENNKKMSKSAGNGIDPLLLINHYGSDALRFALVREVAGAGQDIRLDYDRKKESSSTVEASRNFANKIWNATKFVQMNCSFSVMDYKKLNYDDVHLDLTDQWILSKLNKTKKELYYLLSNYKLGEAAKLIYEFAWNDFCDWYLEFLKLRFNNPKFENRILTENLLKEILDNILIMMNPFMPHITEELWHSLHQETEDIFLSLQRWPSLEEKYLDDNLERSFDNLFEIIRLIRNLRVELGLKPTQHIPVFLVTDDVKSLEFIKNMSEDIRLITKSSDIHIIKQDEFNKKDYAKSFSGIIGNLEVYLPFEGLINLESLREKLLKDQLKADEDIKVLNKRIMNTNFINKAPKNVVDECKSKLKEAKSKSFSISKKLELLG